MDPESLKPRRTAQCRRSRGAALITAADRILAVPEGRRPTQIPDLEPAAGARLWEALITPVTVTEASRAAGLPESVAEAAIDRLVGCGAIDVEPPADVADPNAHPGPPSKAAVRVKPCGRMALGVTGSAQAVFAPAYVQRLLAVFADELDVILTNAAQRFVLPLALSILGARVWTNPSGEDERSEESYLELAEAADLVVVLPATANTIARLALGLCDDTVSRVVAQTHSPVLIAPSMNPVMWNNPAVRRNLKKCRDAGFHVLEPGLGRAAAYGQPGLGAVSLSPSSTALISSLRYLLQEAR